MPQKLPKNADKSSIIVENANVQLLHVGPQDPDLPSLAEILQHADWKMCPGTQWNMFAAGTISTALTQLQSGKVSIVLCERDCAPVTWKDILESVRKLSTPPMFIVTSRTADEHLWAEALNLGAYDVLAKPYYAPEVIRVLSMAWLNWNNRRQAPATLAQAC